MAHKKYLKTNVLQESKKRISVLQGGTRSGKTYSVLLALIEFAWKNKNRGFYIW